MRTPIAVALTVAFATFPTVALATTHEVPAARSTSADAGSLDDALPIAEGAEGVGLAGRLLERFDTARALEDAAAIGRFRRAPGSPGYDAAFDHARRALRAAGFGRRDGLSLEVLTSELEGPAWIGKGARVELLDASGEVHVLHAFGEAHAIERAILPENAPAADVTGEVVFQLRDVVPGSVLVTEARLRADLLRRAAHRGAVAVVSSALAPFNHGPGLDHAVQLRELERGTDVPAFQISPASYDAIALTPGARLRLFADVEAGATSVRTLVATVTGGSRAHEAVVLTAHLQGAGASDDAAGAAGLLGAARLLAAEVGAGRLSRPDRSVVFLLGPESTQVEAWLAETALVPVAGVGVLGIGAGELALERAPDPESALPGLAPNGLSVLARCALADVATGTKRVGEHPYEGGSCLDLLLERGVPAVLLFGEPGALARTSLDRAGTVQGPTLSRGAVAALRTAWALARPAPEALARLLLTQDAERRARLFEAAESGDPDLTLRWQRWFEEARSWVLAVH